MVSKWWPAAALCVAAAVHAAPAGANSKGADLFRGQAASADARYVAGWVLATGDHNGRPFAIVDKKGAQLFVFDASGRLQGATAALLGSAWGDHTVPGVGARAQLGEVARDERTTPAGRFDTIPGKNLSGERIVWMDYASALAIHRLRPGASYKARAARLASATPRDNRASLGCVVVPVDFYTRVVEPVLGTTRAVVYVLPETRGVRDVFGDG